MGNLKYKGYNEDQDHYKWEKDNKKYTVRIAEFYKSVVVKEYGPENVFLPGHWEMIDLDERDRQEVICNSNVALKYFSRYLAKFKGE